MKHSTHAAAALALGLTIATAAACNPTMAPPMRSTHYGAPARMTGHRVEVSGGGTLHGSGGAWGGVRVAPGLRLELGTDLRLVNQENWALGGAGLRYTVDGRNAGLSGVAFDLELGGGFGAGGVLGDDGARSTSSTSSGDDATRWNHRLAAGAYLGLGVAGYLTQHFSLFMRTRGQISRAQGIPITLWGSAVGGLEIALGPVAWYCAGGAAGYRNSIDAVAGPTVETGLSLRLF